MSAGPETKLVARIRKAIAKRYPSAWAIKVHGDSYQETGLPDLLLCVEGHLIGLEVKCPRPGESREHALARATPKQRAQLARIRAAGGTGAVVVSEEEALDVIGRALFVLHALSVT